MKMRNTFARVFTVVDDHPKARLRDPQLRRKRCGDDEQIAQKLLIPSFRQGKTRNLFFRDEKSMHLSDRMDITNRDAAFVFINHLGRKLPVDDPTKECFHKCGLASILQQRKRLLL